MKAHIVESGIVVNTIEVESLDFLPNLVEATEGSIGWLYDGEKFTPPLPPVKSPEELQEEIIKQVQLRLDTFAKTKNYDGILSACTYATSVNPVFKAEGQYCVELRDNTWAVLYQILEEVQSGNRDTPSSYQDVESELPALIWPA